ncbi:endonuclease V [Pedobacter gandavensis]|uniref:Endonuclease V n=1 Tax=Pedobacter gandavensis TaxID=2679963 RepID=A0ABR6ESG7_9SPHI|nr:endonuclease V [Pedobacter gandavensis]MBB2148203.1 endonuclease V [Pedobacter gandavensis]
MKLIIDVAYEGNQAKVVGGFFENWFDDSLVKQSIKIVDNVQDYVSGEFYKRELPCILEFLDEVNLKEIELLIIDGFIYLDDERKKGLGAYLYDSLAEKIPIIGAAKSRFYNNTKYVQEIFRGESKKPLYISAIGIELPEASLLIDKMFGKFRLPSLIKQVDTETKNKW